MNIRSFFAAFGVNVTFNLAIAVLGIALFQMGLYTGYYGEFGINGDDFWATFGGFQSFLALVIGLVVLSILGAITGYLAHRQYVRRAVIFGILIFVVGILMGVFVEWEAIVVSFGGFWSFLWPILVVAAVSAVQTFLMLLAYERFRR
jgi:hypothetical protein